MDKDKQMTLASNSKDKSIQILNKQRTATRGNGNCHHRVQRCLSKQNFLIFFTDHCQLPLGKHLLVLSPTGTPSRGTGCLVWTVARPDSNPFLCLKGRVGPCTDGYGGGGVTSLLALGDRPSCSGLWGCVASQPRFTESVAHLVQDEVLPLLPSEGLMVLYHQFVGRDAHVEGIRLRPALRGETIPVMGYGKAIVWH